MIVKLLTEHHLEFLCLKGGCRGWSESTLVKMSNCWKSHAVAHFTLQASSHCYHPVSRAPGFPIHLCGTGTRLVKLQEQPSSESPTSGSAYKAASDSEKTNGSRSSGRESR